MEIASRWMLFSLTVACVSTVLFVGCQQSNDEFQVISDEMSQPEDDSSAVIATENPAQDDDVAPGEPMLSQKTEVTSTIDPSRAVAEQEERQAAGDDAEKVSLTQSRMNQKSELSPIDSGQTKPNTAAVEPDDFNSAQKSSPAEVDASGAPIKSDSFVSVQAEMERKKRAALLGLGSETEPAEPREIKLLVESREFSKEESHAALRVTFDDIDLLKVLNMEPVPVNAQDYLPDWLTALDGQRIILRGWMYPNEKSEGIKGFVFVRDNQICCFGREAKVYDKLTVRLKSGETTKYIEGRPFDVVGILRIDPWIEPNRNRKTGELVDVLEMLYHLEEATVIDN